MVVFTVRDMRVSAQATAVLEAVRSEDANACVLCNLSSNEVQISAPTASLTELCDALTHAGFDPVLRGSSGPVVRGLRRQPQRIPFVGADHDFSGSSGIDSSGL